MRRSEIRKRRKQSGNTENLKSMKGIKTEGKKYKWGRSRWSAGLCTLIAAALLIKNGTATLFVYAQEDPVLSEMNGNADTDTWGTVLAEDGILGTADGISVEDANSDAWKYAEEHAEEYANENTEEYADDQSDESLDEGGNESDNEGRNVNDNEDENIEVPREENARTDEEAAADDALNTADAADAGDTADTDEDALYCFELSEIICNYGDEVLQNTLTPMAGSETDQPIEVFFRSDTPKVASVNAGSGSVSIQNPGIARISAVLQVLDEWKNPVEQEVASYVIRVQKKPIFLDIRVQKEIGQPDPDLEDTLRQIIRPQLADSEINQEAVIRRLLSKISYTYAGGEDLSEAVDGANRPVGTSPIYFTFEEDVCYELQMADGQIGYLVTETNPENRDTENSNSDPGAEDGSPDTGTKGSSSDTGGENSSADTGTKGSSSDTGGENSSADTGAEGGSSDTGGESSSTDTGAEEDSSDTGGENGSPDTGTKEDSSDTGGENGSPDTDAEDNGSNSSTEDSGTGRGIENDSHDTGTENSSPDPVNNGRDDAHNPEDNMESTDPEKDALVLEPDRVVEETVIEGVLDQHSYSGDVVPTIQLAESGYESFQIQVTKENLNESVDVTRTVLGNEVVQGNLAENDVQTIYGNNLEVIPENDGVYTISVQYRDESGNTAEKKITYTVNRFGSVYAYDDYVKEIVGSWLRKLDKPLRITEYNPDPLVQGSLHIVITRDGEPLDHVLYAVRQRRSESGTESHSGWYQYDYEIAKSNFSKDGIYRIVVYSKDLAGNEPENVTDQNGEIRFQVDRTPPEILQIKGLDEVYSNESVRNISFRAYDAMQLASVRVHANGKVIQELSEFTDANYEICSMEFLEGENQKLYFEVTDMAGNQTISQYYEIRWYRHRMQLAAIMGSIAAAVIFAALYIRRKKVSFLHKLLQMKIQP